MIRINILKKEKGNYLVFIGLGIVFIILLWMIAKPYFGVRYSYTIGDISQEDIIAPRDITYINIKETEKRIEEIKKRASAVFDLNLIINDEIQQKINDFFILIKETGEKENTISDKIEEVYRHGYTTISREVIKNTLQFYKEGGYEEKLTALINFILHKGITELTRSELLEFREKGIILKRIKKTEITQEKVEIDNIIAKDKIPEELTSFLVKNYPGLDTKYLNAIKEIALNFIKPNLFYNQDETDRLLREQISKVEPVLNTIKKGAIIIRRGEEITDENFPKLKAIAQYTSSFNTKAITGISILLMIVLYLSIIPFHDEVSGLDIRNYIVFISFVLFTAFCSYLITLIKSRPYFLPLGVLVPASGMIITAEALFKRKFSLTLAFTISILLLLISANDPYTFIFTLGSGLIAIYSLGEVEKRSDLLKSSIFIVVVNILILTAIGFLKELPSKDFATLLIWGAGNGLVSVILSLGIIPFIEIILNIPTNFRLLELSDLNAPILKKLQIEAPGTYHHSINVANMAENAARYIKANPLLVRVAALYHDIGKLPNAQYFIENTQGVSKHNYLKPSLSNSILKAHVKIGVEMARELKLPMEIIDIIAQHHGTSLMKYFYHQALKKDSKQAEVEKQDYHYQGPKPQSREAAIVMLADAVEAASRTLKNPSAKRIEEFVNDIVESKFREGQLNESTLTLRGLMKISIVFRRYLTGVFHSRIEYPEEKEFEISQQDNKLEGV